MVYRVEVHPAVSAYLREMTWLTREGRLAMIGFMDALRYYGDEARQSCPRQPAFATIFRLRWTFHAGPAIASLDVYVDDADAGSAVLRVAYVETVPLHGQ